jgi:spermidine/putrescine transport system permease protein
VGEVQVRVGNTAPARAGRLRSLRTSIEDAVHGITSAVAITWLIPFFVFPLGIMVLYSFISQDYITGKFTYSPTLTAWDELFDDVFFEALLRSIGIATVAMVGCALFGYPLAYFVARHAGRFQNAALLLIIVPFWMSFIVRAFAWLDILGDQGYLNEALRSLGLIDEPLQLVNNSAGIVIGIIYGYLPLMVFPLYVSLQRIDPRVFEASRDLGASAFTTFRRVTFPLALPGLIAGCIIVWIPALGEYVVPQILGGAKTYMVGNIIASDFERFTWPEGAAAALTLMGLAFVFLAVVRLLAGRERLGEAFE